MLVVCLLPGILFSTAAHAQSGSGTAVILPATDVAAGSSGTWTVTYTATTNFSTGVVSLTIPADWTAPQISSNFSAGYVTAASEGTLNGTPISIAGNIITINVDTLTADETVTIVYGAPAGAADAQTLAESSVEFTVGSNPLGPVPSDITAGSPTLNVVAAPVSKLVFTTASRTLKADGESQVMRIQAQDEFDNPSMVGSAQTVSLSSTSGAGTFSHLPAGSWSATTTVTISAGEDTVSFYYRGTSPGIYDITASPDGQSWTDAEQQVTVDPGDPAKLVISPLDTIITAGEYGRYILRSVDILGNPSAPAADQTITLLKGGGEFYDKDDHGTTVTQLIIPSGSTFAEVDFMHTVKNFGGGFVLAFLDNDGVDPILESATAYAKIDHADADTSASSIEVDKATATADDIDQIVITATIRDQFGNTVDGVAVVLSDVSGSDNTITQPGANTGADGIATGSIISTRAEIKDIRAAADGTYLEDIVPVAFTAGPVDPAVSTIGAVPATVPANGTDVTTVTVTARDQYGNAVPGAAVVLAASGTGNTITQPAVVTDAAGQATGTIASTVAELKTISATINGAGLVPTVAVDFITGTFSIDLSFMDGDKAEVTADGVDALGVTVTVRDQYDNPVVGAAVTLEATGSGNTVNQPVGVTGAGGTTTGSVLSTIAEQKVIRALIGVVQITDTLIVDWVAGPVDLAVSTIGAVPATVPANGTDVTTVTVTARDADGNAVPGAAVVLAASGTGNTITQPAVVTDAAGQATGTIASTVAELKTISATINGAGLVPTVAVDFITGTFSIDLSFMEGDKAEVTADGVDALGVTVTVRDQYDNPVVGAAVTLEATGSGNTVNQPVGVTGAGGTTTGSVLSTVAEQKVIRALIGVVQITDTLIVDWVAGPVDLAVSTIGAVPATVPANGTDVTTVTATARDADGNAVPGAAVVLAASGTGNTITQPAVVTDAAGQATGTIASTVAELKTISATINGAGLVPTVAVDFITGTFSIDLSFMDGDKAEVTADGVDALGVTVTVRDQYDNPVVGAAVTLEATGSGNTVNQPVGVTGAGGTTTGSVLSTIAEQKVIRALIGVVQITDTLIVDWVAGPVDLAVSTIGAVPATVPANGTDVTTVTVTARDADGNAVPGAAVVLAASGTGNTITQPAVVTDAAGQATGTIASTVAELKTISATINGAGLVPTVAVDFITGTFSIDLSFMDGDKAEVTADGVDALGVTVTVRDQYDNPVVGAAVTLEATGSGNTVNQPVGVTGAGGTTTGSVLSTVAEQKVIRALIGVVQITDTLIVDWVAGPVDLAVSTIGAVPATVPANGTDVTTVTVTARDQYGNAVPGAAVVLAASGTGNTITQPAVVTDAAGQATGTIASTVAELKTISATINGAGLVPTVAVDFITGTFSIDLSFMDGDKAEVTADGVDVLGVTVTVRDQYDNPVVGASVTLEATGSGNTVNQPVGVTGAGGTTTGSVLSTVAEQKVIRALIGVVQITDTLIVDWVAGPVDLAVSTIGAVPATVPANGTDVTTVTVTARDADGNAVPGAAVVLAASGTGNTITQPAVVTDAAGQATGTIASTVAELKTISATINGAGLVPTVAVDFITGTFSIDLSFMDGDKAEVTADGVDVLGVTVTVRDQYDNPVVGASVTLEATGSGNTVNQPVGVTGAGGTTTGSVLSTVAEQKVIRALIGVVQITDTLIVDWVAGPVDLAVSTIGAVPATVPANGTDVTTVTVTARDQYGNAVPGAAVVLAASGTGNTITQPAVVTDAAGQATGTIASTVAELKTISATINGAGLVPTVAVDFITGTFSIDLSFMDGDKAEVTADGVDVLGVTVTVRDQYDNPVVGASVTLEATGSGNTVNQPVGVTGAGGTTTGSVLSTVAEQKVIRALIGVVQITDTLIVDWVAGPVDLAVSTIGAVPATVPANGTDVTTVTVTVLDTQENPIEGAVVQLQSDGTDNIILQPVGVTDSNGIAVGSIASTNAEIKNISATIDGNPLIPTAVVEFITGTFSIDLSFMEGDKAEVTADGVDVLGVTVTVRDQYDNPVVGASVTLEASGSGNTVNQPVGVTGAGGTTTGSVLSTVAEQKVIRALIGVVQITDTLIVDWVAGPVDLAVSTIGAVPATVPANGTDVTTVTVTVLDTQENPIEGAVVQLQSDGTDNIILQPVGVTDSNGIAVGSIASTNAEIKNISATIDGNPLIPTAVVEFITGTFSIDLSFMEGDKAEVTADGVDVLGVTVTVRDQYDNPVVGASVTLEASGSGNTVNQPVGGTDVDGIASGTVASTFAEQKVVRALIGVVQITDTLIVDWVAGPVDLDRSLIFSNVDTVTADGSDNCRITVVVRDANDNAISGSSVVLEATDTGGNNTIFQPSANTDENGIAVGWISSTYAELKAVSARIDGTLMNGTHDVAFIAGEPDRFVISHDGAGIAGTSEDISLEIFDANDNIVDWFDDIIQVYTDSPELIDRVDWTLGPGASGSITVSGDTVRYDFSPSDNGEVILGYSNEKAETVYFTARYGAVADQSAQSMTIAPALPDRIFIISGADQRAVVGQAVPQPLIVGVEDEFGNRVPGYPVRFLVINGGGTIDVDTSMPPDDEEWTMTDGSGVAGCDSWILGTTSGEGLNRALGLIADGTTLAVQFVATTDHDELASVVLTPDTADVTVNSNLIVTATMTDQFDNLVVGENLTIFIKDVADGTLAEDTGNPNPTVTLGPGIRSGSSDSTGTVTVQYNSPAFAGLQDIVDAYHAVLTTDLIADAVYSSVASGATKLIVTDITGQPSQAGVPFSFTVRAVDSNDNLDPEDTSHIVLSPESGGGLIFSTVPDFAFTITEADLSGGEIELFATGTATGDWNINISDSPPDLTGVDFTAFITANDTVHHYAILAPPGVVAGVDFTVSLEARDEWDNHVTTAAYDIDLRAVQPADTAAAGSVLNITAGTISNGIFSEENLRYDLAEPIRVEISDDITSVVGFSGIVDVGHAPAWQIVEISGDTTGVAAGDSILLSMRVLDSFGNPVGGETVSFSILEGGGGLVALQRVTGTDGSTSVSYATGETAGTNRVRAAILDGNPEGLETREFVIETVPQSAIAYVILDITGDTFEAGEGFTGHVTAYDQFSNPITTDNSTRLIPVAQSASIDFLPDTLQLAFGEASFTATDTVMGTNRIFIEDLSGVTRGASGFLTITAGPAYELVKISGDTTGVISGDTTEVLVRVADVYGNPVQDETVRFLITSSLGGSPSLIDGTGAPDDGLVLSAADGTAACSLVTDTNYGTNNVLTTILDGTPARETAIFDVITSAGSISRYTVIPVGMTHTAGESFNVEITGYDLNNNVAEGDFTTIVDLGSDGTAAWAENPITLSDGRYVVSVSETIAGRLVLNAETQLDGTARSYSDTITIVPDEPSGTIPTSVAVGSDTITADGVSLSAVTAGPVRDMYTNLVPERTKVTVTTSDGTVTSEDLDPGEPGIQRETGPTGLISAFVQSSATPGDAHVEFSSVSGTAYGDTFLTFAPMPNVEYADSIYPIYAVPGSDLTFSIRVTNTSRTRVLLGAASTISFSDGLGHEFSAVLGSVHSLDGLETADLIFLETTMHSMFEPGTYTPRISLAGTDEYGSAYMTGFDAGANSVSVSSIEISSILPIKNVVSRGDTAVINVTITNTGGAVVRVEEIDLLFASGNYLALPDSTLPVLPDTLPAGLSETYALKTIVLPNCPLGVDTIDAQVTARVNGYEVTDLSADHNVATWTVQSSALISYEAGTFAPSIVSTGQVHSFTFDLMNSGEAAVILEAGLTTMSFTDGTETYSVSLIAEGALPGGTVSDLEFPATAIPAAMVPGAWPVTVALTGTENGGEFDTSFVLSDPVTVVSPASVSYTVATLSPATVSNNSSVAFEVGITNTGGADVLLDPATTSFELDDGITTYIAYLDGARNILLAPGDNTIWFEALTVPPGFITNSYMPAIDLSGTENGLPFIAQPSVTDAVSVQDASQLAINSTDILPTDLFTADQAGLRVTEIRVANNGGAEVRLDSLDVRFYIGGSEVTGEYLLTPLPDVAGIQVPGGADTLVRMMFADGAGSMTTGTVTVESSLWGTDLNSTDELEATTEYGGKGSFTVQTPAVLVVDHLVASVTEATAGQARNWTVDVIVRNDGESDLALDLGPAATDLTFSTSDDFIVISPTVLEGSGTDTLAGGTSDTLRFTIDVTGLIAGNCQVNMATAGTEINSGRTLGPVIAATPDEATVEIQSAALLQVVSVTPLADPVTIGQSDEWSIDMLVSNGGGSSVTLDLGSIDSTAVTVEGGTGFVFTRPASLLEGGLSILAGGSGTLRFAVTTTGTVPAGATALSGSIIGTEGNSGARVFDEITIPNSIVFELQSDPAYTANSLTPTIASTGSEIGIQLDISNGDSDHSTLILDRERTEVWFGDVDGDTFRTDLSAVSPVMLDGGLTTTLTFNSAQVSVDLDRIGYIVGIHLEGTENGNSFAADITSESDSLYIEEASQLSISSIVIPQSVTAGEQPDWDVKMVIHNSGEASVMLALEPDSTDMSISIAGIGDVTGEYTITRPTELSIIGGQVLPGGQTDTLVFNITSTGITTGTAVVNGNVTAIDINSSEILTDDTYTSGGSYMAVQHPALPVVLETIASQDSVTSSQTTSWNVTVLVRNAGEATMTLQPGITAINADPYPLTVSTPPTTFVGGGTVLAAGEEGHLEFEITPTPSIPAGDDLIINALAGFTEDNNGISREYDTGAEGSGYGGVRVQAPANLSIVALSGNAPRQPFVNRNQDFPLAVEITNTGEAAAEAVSTDLTGNGSSIINNSPVIFETIAGGETVVDTFLVTAADLAGVEEFTTSIIFATDVNSGQLDLVTVSPGVDTTETMTIQNPAGLAVTSVLPSQTELNAGQTADWTIRVDLVNNGYAPATIDIPAPDDIEFLYGGSPLTGYLVVPPVTFGSGNAGWTLDGSSVDYLIYIVSTTGTDTGMVDINADISWIDENDPGAAASTSSGSSSIHVHEPSGLRIISVSSNAPNNDLLPNTSIVNTGQLFHVTVTVENTGGDDLERIVLSFTSNGPASITELSLSPDLPNGTSGDFVYEVSSGTAGVEILTAEIIEAYSVNTGEPVSPIQAVESVENMQVQAPASLVTSAYVQSPAGALDDTLSTDQQFVFAATVENTGQSELDDFGQVTLSLPEGFSRVYLDTDSLTMTFIAGQEIVWTLLAPATAQASPQPVYVSITRTPRDINIDADAFVQKNADTVSIVTEDAAAIADCLTVVSEPPGARDLVLSTGQDFVVTFTAVPSANSRSNTATIVLPMGFTTTGNLTVLLGDGDGNGKTAEWTVTAPEVVRSTDEISVSTAGTDDNSGISFPGCEYTIFVDVVSRAVLSLTAEISAPEEARDGNLSVNLPFTITAQVSNAGTAGIDTAGARLEIVLPSGGGYDLDLDVPGETYRKTFYPGEYVTWNLRAPLAAVPPRIITIRFTLPAATDENTNEPVAYGTSEVPIGVTTESGTITMQNVSHLASIPPVVVPRGAADVPVMRVVFRNNAEYTAGLDTLFVSVEDGNGNLRNDPSRYVSAITLSSAGGSWPGPVGSENPVPVIVDHAFTLNAGASDTALVSIDISTSAPDGELRINLAESDDVVFSIGDDGSPINVVRDANGEDIAGYFFNTPLSVMSASFEEYVHNYPNPFMAGSEITKIAYFLTQDTSVSIKIYDYTGVLVWTKDIPAGGPGGSGEPAGTWWEADWDGRNGRGNVVRNGVYICKVTAGGNSAMFKIAVAK